MFVINILRLIYIIKLLSTDELDVRNSTLDRLTSLTDRVIFCYVCEGTE